MRSVVVLAAGALVASSVAFAQQLPATSGLLTTVPTSSHTVTDWYRQDVYDPSHNKIGQVSDVLVGQNGQIDALIIGVGGFLGAGEKDVAVNFSSVRQQTDNNNNKIYLTMNTTKDALKAAPGFKYDSNSTAWVPDNNR
jgi:sporulation protein YlmC with PRC-barrel domain